MVSFGNKISNDNVKYQTFGYMDREQHIQCFYPKEMETNPFDLHFNAARYKMEFLLLQQNKISTAVQIWWGDFASSVTTAIKLVTTLKRESWITIS